MRIAPFSLAMCQVFTQQFTSQCFEEDYSCMPVKEFDVRLIMIRNCSLAAYSHDKSRVTYSSPVADAFL